MLWTMIFVLIFALVFGMLAWARGVRYRTGRYIHLKCCGSEATCRLPENGTAELMINRRRCTLYRDKNGIVSISYGNTDEELRWMWGYRFDTEDKHRLRLIGTSRRNKMPYLRFVILGAAAAFVILTAFFGVYRFRKLDELLDTAVSADVLHSSSDDVFSDDDMTNILFAVTDSEGKADMIRIVSFNRRNKSLKVMSLLGDAEVVSGGQYIRLCETDISVLPLTVEENYFMHIDEYVRTDTVCAAEYADNLGGVSVYMNLKEASALNELIREEYGEACECVPEEKYFPSDGITVRKIHLSGRQAVCYARLDLPMGEDDDYRSRTLAKAERQNTVMGQLFSRRSFAGLLLHTSRFGSCAEKTVTSITSADLIRLGADTGSYWRNYRDSCNNNNDIILPSRYEELHSGDGITLYTYPGEIRQETYRILYFDMKG